MNDAALNALAVKAYKEMKAAGALSDVEHGSILDKYEPIVRGFGESRIGFMVRIGRHSGVLKDYKMEYGL